MVARDCPCSLWSPEVGGFVKEGLVHQCDGLSKPMEPQTLVEPVKPLRVLAGMFSFPCLRSEFSVTLWPRAILHKESWPTESWQTVQPFRTYYKSRKTLGMNFKLSTLSMWLLLISPGCFAQSCNLGIGGINGGCTPPDDPRCGYFITQLCDSPMVDTLNLKRLIKQLCCMIEPCVHPSDNQRGICMIQDSPQTSGLNCAQPRSVDCREFSSMFRRSNGY